jgi:hypothetical protein
LSMYGALQNCVCVVSRVAADSSGAIVVCLRAEGAPEAVDCAFLAGGWEFVDL